MSGVPVVAGVGATKFSRYGAGKPLLTMSVQSALAACADAGIASGRIDGFVTYSSDVTEGPLLARALGCQDIRLSAVASGGGGGLAGAIALACAAIRADMASAVLIWRSVSGRDVQRGHDMRAYYNSHYRAHGVISAVQTSALATQRLLELHHLPRSCLEAVVRASYHHAQATPAAMAYGRPLSEEDYRAARIISTPFTLYDCSRETDGAQALIVMDEKRAAGGPGPKTFVYAESSGPGDSGAENNTDYVTANVRPAACRLWARTGIGPRDIDVAQIYENTSGGAVLALLDAGFCTPETAGDFLTFENLIAPSGQLPINTAGGNTAGGFGYGLALAVEAVQQVRGIARVQVPDVTHSFVSAGPHAAVTGAVIFSRERLE